MRRTLQFVLLAALLAVGPARSSAQYQKPAAPAPASAGAQPAQSASAAAKPAPPVAEPKAAAEEDENAQFKQSPSIQWMAHLLGISTSAAYWMAVLLNFAVVALLVAVMVKKAVPPALRQRGESIRKQIEDAQQAGEDAARRVREIEARLNKIGGEIQGLQSEAIAQQHQEEARLKAAAEEEKQRILRSAQQEIDSAAAGARRDLRAYAAGLAVELAEKKIQIDGATDQALVRDFAARLEGNGK